jgi:peptidoglycan/LPS O-acetylase OafA/YrhL
MSTAFANQNQRYRPDVDGLRAVAILSVIAFHAFPNLVQGGFVGVDVFFVISGFLITSVIVNSLEAGNFSFLVFYQHRIRRIFPALGLVLASCAVAGWYLLPEGAYAELGKHIAGGAGFVANLVLWKEAGYFDSASDTKPLLHLWSLGIEEQFYFVWPFVLWAAWRRRWNLLLVTATVLLASFCANVAIVGIDAVANFYSPATRVWELLIGALLAGKVSTNRWRGFQANVANPIAVGGLGAIFVAEFLLTKDKLFPGWWALLPTLGAASIIAAGPAAWVNRRLLSHPAMVWIGLISYPLYLWHWPILAFLRITGVLKSPLEIGVCAIGVAFVLSWLTYRFVERPFRSQRVGLTSRIPGRRGPPAPIRRVAGLLAFMTLAAVVGGLIHQTNGSISRDRLKIASLPALPDKSVFERLKIYEHYDQPNTTCRDPLGMSLLPEEVCITNSPSPKVMFFGDSHAMGLYSAIFADQVAVPSVLIASPGCLVYPNLTYRPMGKEWGQDCTELARKGLAYANRSPDIGTVVISMVRKGDNPESLTNFYSGDRQMTEREVLSAGTDHLIRSLLSSGKTVIYVVDVPYFHNTPEICLSKALVSGTDQCVFNRSKMNAPFKVYFDVLGKIQKENPGLKILNAEDVLCRKDTCAQHDDAQYFYIDKDHLSVYGSETVLASLFRQFPVD